MATKAMMEKAKRQPKHPTQRVSRCRLCGRPRAYMRDFQLCRICFRKLAHRGEIPGVTKASW